MNRQHLILLAGAPGVGKTATARYLLYSLNRASWADGDAFLRVNPRHADQGAQDLVERNMRCVVGNYLEDGYTYVIVTWPMHRQEIIDRICSWVEGRDVLVHPITLYCTEAALRLRWENDPKRGPIPQVAIDCLNESLKTNTLRIDTTGMEPAHVAQTARKLISQRGNELSTK